MKKETKRRNIYVHMFNCRFFQGLIQDTFGKDACSVPNHFSMRKKWCLKQTERTLFQQKLKRIHVSMTRNEFFEFFTSLTFKV